MKYTFFLDIDGTLIHAGNRYPTEELLRIVKQAQEMGHRFFINTARSYGNVDPKQFPIDRFDGLCSGCGTCIVYEGRMIYKNVLTPEKAFFVAETLLSSNPKLKFVLEGVEALYPTFTNPWKPVAVHPFETVAELRERFPDLEIQKFATYGGDLIPPETVKPLMDEFDVYFHLHYTEIVPKGYGKGKAAEIVEKLLCIPHEATVAVGDSHNDVPMFKSCAIAIAMGNSPDDVKKEADTVTERVEEDGAAKAIARLCKIPYDAVIKEIQAESKNKSLI